jgi:alpha-amylase/alpha-mannosidase (GH57 family)
MWLPETAVDDETLKSWRNAGEVHSPRALASRPFSLGVDVLDSTHPYLIPLEGGKELAVFFYDQELSTRVSFDPASTINADQFFSEYDAQILPSCWG